MEQFLYQSSLVWLGVGVLQFCLQIFNGVMAESRLFIQRRRLQAQTISDQRPSVSVLVLCHNGADQLSACLGSIQASTLRPDQLIILDNASSDNSAKVVHDYLKQHKDLPIRLITFRKPRNYTQCVNYALKRWVQTDAYLVLRANCQLSPRSLQLASRALSGAHKVRLRTMPQVVHTNPVAQRYGQLFQNLDLNGATQLFPVELCWRNSTNDNVLGCEDAVVFQTCTFSAAAQAYVLHGYWLFKKITWIGQWVYLVKNYSAPVYYTYFFWLALVQHTSLPLLVALYLVGLSFLYTIWTDRVLDTSEKFQQAMLLPSVVLFEYPRTCLGVALGASRFVEASILSKY